MWTPAFIWPHIGDQGIQIVTFCILKTCRDKFMDPVKPIENYSQQSQECSYIYVMECLHHNIYDLSVPWLPSVNVSYY